jgi:hypothetical protein
MSNPNTTRIARAWADFRRVVIEPDAPEIQLREMRRAFSAGAVFMFNELLGMMDKGEEITNADIVKMDGIQTEIDEMRLKMIGEAMTPPGTRLS